MAKTKTAPALMSEKDWRAQDDARVIAQAAAIKKDPARLKAAATAAKSMIEEKTQELRGLRTVARKAK